MGNASALAGFLLLLGVAATPVGAQTSPDGAYAKLSAGNQRIALALFDAQQANLTAPAPAASTAETTTAGATNARVGATTVAAKPMTLDQIAAQKQGGLAWGEIFQRMKDHGLVQEKNLGQVVSRYQRNGGSPSGSSQAKSK